MPSVTSTGPTACSTSARTWSAGRRPRPRALPSRRSPARAAAPPPSFLATVPPRRVPGRARPLQGGIERGGAGEPAVDVDHLAVDPATRPGEEGDRLGHVLRLAEALQRSGIREVGDGGVVLAVEE